jgi:hypothetical protein
LAFGVWQKRSAADYSSVTLFVCHSEDILHVCFLWSILFSPSSSSYNSIVFPSEEIETEKTAVFISPVSLAKGF